jgi:hypothetical protein
MTHGAVTISDLLVRGETHLALECQRCTLRGRYSLAKMLDERGDVGLPDLLVELSADCPQRHSVGAFDRCGARYVGL